MTDAHDAPGARVQGRQDAPSGLTVGQLRQHLEGLRDDVLVVLAKDGEGNGFSPLAEAELSDYTPDTTWDGSIGVGGEVCVLLWPTN